MEIAPFGPFPVTSMHSNHPPIGPDDVKRENVEAFLKMLLDCLAERLVSSSPPLPENDTVSDKFRLHTAQLELLQRQVWSCHWGFSVVLSVYEQLIAHADAAVRRQIAEALGASLGEGLQQDEHLAGTIAAHCAQHGVSFRPDMGAINRDLHRSAMQSTVVCYIRDMALALHTARLNLNPEDTREPLHANIMSTLAVSRPFFTRLLAVSSQLLDLIYDVMPVMPLHTVA